MTRDPPPHPALLPTGLAGLLPPAAERETTLLGIFTAHGCERVKPPLFEFESALLAAASRPLGLCYAEDRLGCAAEALEE